MSDSVAVGPEVKEGDEPIKLTYLQVWDSGQQSLSKLLGMEASFKAVDSEKLGAWGGILIAKVKEIDKVRIKLLKEHGDSEKEGGLELKVGTDAHSDFQEAFDEYLKQTFEINLKPVMVGGGMRIAPIIFAHLGFMLEVK